MEKLERGKPRGSAAMKTVFAEIDRDQTHAGWREVAAMSNDPYAATMIAAQ